MNFGARLKELRRSRRLTLREFCEQVQADPAFICRVERETLNPPLDKMVLTRYAEVLGILNTVAVDEFIALAQSSQGQLRGDLAESAVAGQQPLFLRDADGNEMPKEKLGQLAELLKGY